jgi:hypothetical protein
MNPIRHVNTVQNGVLNVEKFNLKESNFGEYSLAIEYFHKALKNDKKNFVLFYF